MFRNGTRHAATCRAYLRADIDGRAERKEGDEANSYDHVSLEELYVSIGRRKRNERELDEPLHKCEAHILD